MQFTRQAYQQRSQEDNRFPDEIGKGGAATFFAGLPDAEFGLAANVGRVSLSCKVRGEMIRTAPGGYPEGILGLWRV